MTKMLRIATMVGIGAMIAGCVPRAEPPPPAPPPPAPPPPAPQPPPPPPQRTDWRDMPLTPGAWTYAATGGIAEARFGPAGREPLFAVRCDRSRQIVLARGGASGGNAITIRTSTDTRTLPAALEQAPRQALAASVAANDRILDSMVFSRGRYTIEAPGAAMLVIPSWPEPARVIEECRG